MKSFLSICSLILLFGVSIGEGKGSNNNNPVPVNVKNTPLPVNVQNQVPVNVQNQVVTSNVHDPVAQPYDKFMSASATTDNDTLSFDVPAGKRLVIESITLYVAVPTGQNIWGAGFSTHNENAAVPHTLVLTSQGSDGHGSTRFAAVQPVRAFSDPGTGSVTVYFTRDSTSGTMSGGASVTGYLVDLPTVPN